MSTTETLLAWLATCISIVVAIYGSMQGNRSTVALGFLIASISFFAFGLENSQHLGLYASSAGCGLVAVLIRYYAKEG